MFDVFANVKSGVEEKSLSLFCSVKKLWFLEPLVNVSEPETEIL